MDTGEVLDKGVTEDLGAAATTVSPFMFHEILTVELEVKQRIDPINSPFFQVADTTVSFLLFHLSH